jgi:hypothetical protein
MKANKRMVHKKKKVGLDGLGYEEMQYDANGYEVRIIGGNNSYRKANKKGARDNSNEQDKSRA